MYSTIAARRRSKNGRSASLYSSMLLHYTSTPQWNCKSQSEQPDGPLQEPGLKTTLTYSRSSRHDTVRNSARSSSKTCLYCSQGRNKCSNTGEIVAGDLQSSSRSADQSVWYIITTSARYRWWTEGPSSRERKVLNTDIPSELKSPASALFLAKILRNMSR